MVWPVSEWKKNDHRRKQFRVLVIIFTQELSEADMNY